MYYVFGLGASQAIYVRFMAQSAKEDVKKKNDCVSETLLFQKYKGLVFHDPNSENDFCIWVQNMEFRHGRGYGWFLLRVCADNGVEDETFTLELAREMIWDKPQKDGIQAVHKEPDQE
jgi:hypothetical protein